MSVKDKVKWTDKQLPRLLEQMLAWNQLLIPCSSCGARNYGIKMKERIHNGAAGFRLWREGEIFA